VLSLKCSFIEAYVGCSKNARLQNSDIKHYAVKSKILIAYFQHLADKQVSVSIINIRRVRQKYACHVTPDHVFQRSIFSVSIFM
jgi:hypothetical protein